MTVSLIPIEVCDIVAPAVERHLAKSLEMTQGREDITSVWQRVISGEYHLWMFFDENNAAEGALITRFEIYPLKRILNLMFIGGENIEAWHEELLETLERFAKENGCDGLEIVGRYGWKKFLKKFGWEASFIICERMFEIADEEQQDAA